MKRYLKILISFILFFNFINIISYAQTPLPIPDRLQKIKERGILTVASTGDAPFAYIDENTGELTGVSGDIIQEVARRLEISRVEMKQVPFYDLLNELQSNNEIDMIVDKMHSTPERRKEVMFTTLLYKDYDTILTTKFSKFVFGESLKAAVVGVLKGSILEDRANKLKQEGKIKDIVLFNDETDLLKNLASGKVDVALTGAVNAQYQISKDSKSIYKVLPTTEYVPTLIGGVAFPIRKTDLSLLLAVNEKIDDMRIDGTLQKILKKYGLDEKFFL